MPPYLYHPLCEGGSTMPFSTRQKIIRCTILLFNQLGPMVPMSKISEAAGVAAGTPFRYFSTKEELLAAAYREAHEKAGTESVLSIPAFKLRHPLDNTSFFGCQLFRFRNKISFLVFSLFLIRFVFTI